METLLPGTCHQVIGDRPGWPQPDRKAQQTGLHVGRNLEVGPCGQFTQRLRRDTGELAVFHDDEIRTGLDRGPPRSLGCTLHGGVRPYSGTFMCFTDYARPAMRLAALMRIPTVFVMTHDSIGLGEDGPTHQPIETLASLRALVGSTGVIGGVERLAQCAVIGMGEDGLHHGAFQRGQPAALQLVFRGMGKHGGSHYVRIGDGRFSATGGWPSRHMLHQGGGWLGLPPTGRAITMRVMDFYSAEQGLIRENWVPIDLINVLLQLDIDVLARARSQWARRG